MSLRATREGKVPPGAAGQRRWLRASSKDLCLHSDVDLLVLFGGFCFLAAVWRELRPGAPPPKPDTRRMPAPLLIAINGFLAFVSLMALVGIWIAPG